MCSTLIVSVCKRETESKDLIQTARKEKAERSEMNKYLFFIYNKTVISLPSHLIRIKVL